MGTVFQHLPKLSEETIYSITLFKKSNKISKMQAFVLCCALFFIGCVNGAPGLRMIEVAKRSDGQEHLANRAGPQEREVVDRIIPRFESDESRQVIAKRDDEPRQIAQKRIALLLITNGNGRDPVATALKKKFGDEPKENVGGDEAKEQVLKNTEDVNPIPELRMLW